jgi:hypothetical protein
MAVKRNQLDATMDAATQLKDAGAAVASGAGTVGGAARVVNVGPAILSAVFTVDIIAQTIDATAAYDIRLQASNDPTFATDVSIVAHLQSVLIATGGEDRPGIGRRSIPFVNIGEDGQAKTYLRAYHTISGTTPSINYAAMITQNPLP